MNKTLSNLSVNEIAFTDLFELLGNENETLDVNKKDKLMISCECDDINKLEVGKFINTVNELTLAFDGSQTQSFVFRNDYQISNIDKNRKTFSFFIDKNIHLDVERMVCGYEVFKDSEYFDGHEQDDIFLYCKSFHYFDTTDNINDSGSQEIPIYFRYQNGDGELVTECISFRYYDYSTLTTSMTTFCEHEELFKNIFNADVKIEKDGKEYYITLPPKPDDTDTAPYGWKRVTINKDGINYYSWVAKESEYDIDSAEDIQSIEGNLNGIEIYRENFLFTEKTFYEFKIEEIFTTIDVPIINTFDTNLFQTELLKEYFIDAERKKVINRIVDIEKDVYYPCIPRFDENGEIESLDDVYKIKFNLHFREHRTEDWIVKSNSFWNGVKQDFYYKNNETDVIITEEEYNEIDDDEVKEKYVITDEIVPNTASINTNVTNDDVSDLLSFLDFTNGDVHYQKNKLKKSFLRLLFYDSTNPANQNLLSYSTLFIDSGNLFSKYIRLIEDENYANIDYNKNDVAKYNLSYGKNGIRVNREHYIVENDTFISDFDEEKRLSTQLSVSSKNTSTSSSDGFYLYIWKDNSSTIPQDLYMKVEFNHAGYGRTLPFMMPFWDRHKWEIHDERKNGGIKTFQEILDDWNDKKNVNSNNGTVSWENDTDGHYGIRQYNKFSYIHLKYRYDKVKDKHYYYIDPETYGIYPFADDDKEIIINLYEAKIE